MNALIKNEKLNPVNVINARTRKVVKQTALSMSEMVAMNQALAINNSDLRYVRVK